MSFASVDDKLFGTSFFAYGPDKVFNVFPRIHIIDTQSTLHSDRNCDLTLHLFYDSCDKMRVFHQNCTKSSLHDLIRGASAIDIDFIISEILANLCSLSHRYRITPAQLTDHRVLNLREGKESVSSLTCMQDGIFVNHLGVEPSSFRH